jgi:hypothetical protein
MEQVKAEAPQRPRPLTLGRTLTTGECMLQTQQRLRGGPAADAVARALRCAAVFIAVAVLFNGAAMFIAGPAKWAGRAAYVSFRLVGLLGVLFWALRPAAAHDSAAGSKALIRFLHALAGACFVVRCQHCNEPALLALSSSALHSTTGLRGMAALLTLSDASGCSIAVQLYLQAGLLQLNEEPAPWTILRDFFSHGAGAPFARMQPGCCASHAQPAAYAHRCRQLMERFCTAMFHVLDAISVFITLLLVAAVEDGVRAAAEMVLLAPLLSPGAAAALYLAKRERRIAGLADEEERTKAA